MDEPRGDNPTRRRRRSWSSVRTAALAVAVLVSVACSAETEDLHSTQAAPGIAADGSVAVAEGSSFGVEWSLRARQSNAVVCLDLDDGSGGEGSDCGQAVSRSDIRFGSQQAGQQTPVFVLGQVGKKVASVDVLLETGETRPANLVRVDGLPVNAYVAVLPPGSSPTGVIARNALGLKIATSS